MGLEAWEIDAIPTVQFHNPPTNFLVNPILFTPDIQYINLNTADSCRAGCFFLSPTGQLDGFVSNETKAVTGRLPDLSEISMILFFSVWHA